MISFANNVSVVTEDGSGVLCKDLIAGQNIVAGTVCVVADNDGVCFVYETFDGWKINQTHLWAGLNISEMPQNRKGNPKIGLFPYGDDQLDTDIYTICIPYNELGLSVETICNADQLVLFAAHAALSKVIDGEVVQTETGWADGDPITDKGSWAMFGSVTLGCDDGPEPPNYDNCETAFAFGNTELDDLSDPLDPTKPLTSRWGWQIGPISTGSDTIITEIYSGAGQNDITKGTLVGYLTINYDSGIVDVDYVMLPGFIMTETHLYVGHTDIETAAPGQFGNSNENIATGTDGYSIQVENFGHDIFVVAHAVVCEIQE
jgi:hypothetical protein